MKHPVVIPAKFDPGQIVATSAVMAKLDPEYAMGALMQHLQGKWGMVDAEDAAANDRALRNGSRLLSSYPLPDEAGYFWIITEADRSATMFLLPSEC